MADIRPGRPTDVARLAEIEILSSAMFAAIGMFNDELRRPLDAHDMTTLDRHISAELLWVAVDGRDEPVGYVMTGIVDGTSHLDQETVHPDHGRQGIGRQLIEHSIGRAQAAGFTKMTLTTYAQVPWNAPYYSRLGFVRVPDADLSPGLVALRSRERDLGLDEWPRLVMARGI